MLNHDLKACTLEHPSHMENRIIELESRFAEQERVVDELSSTIAEQWKIIDRLQTKLDALSMRFLTLEEQTQPDIPITPPPHW